jgi:tetratricopeptide (TPR) repeat protein
MNTEAVHLFQKAIHLKPDFPGAYNSLGIYRGHQGHLEEAVAALKKAIALNPDFSEAFCNLGIAYSLQGKLPEAMAMFQQALKVNPANAGAEKMWQLVRENAGK